MSSTNKTANYNLSQYIGTDKPTYLGDYNGDMNKIDAQMKANSDAASAAATSAGSALSKAESTESLVETLQENVNTNTQDIAEVTQTANSALSTANSANSLAQQAQNSANTIDQKLNKNSWTPFTQVTNINSKFATTERTFGCSYNPYLNLLKFSGTLSGGAGTSLSANEVLFTLPANVLRPTSTRYVPNLLNLNIGAGSTLGYKMDVNINSSGQVIATGAWNDIREMGSQDILVTAEW